MPLINVRKLKLNLSKILNLVHSKKEEFIIEYGKKYKIAKIVPYNLEDEKIFNTKDFFGIENFNKDDINSFLENSKSE